MDRKYELTQESIVVDGHILYRIKALRNFSNVKVGDFGGYIEFEDNLSHEGKCWVYDNSQVYEDANVSENAKVYGKSQVYGDARVYETAQVHGRAEVYGNAKVHGDGRIFRGAKVYGNAQISGLARVLDNAQVCGDAYICTTTLVHIYGYIKIDYGTWTGRTKLGDDWYLLSPTLDKCLMNKWSTRI